VRVNSFFEKMFHDVSANVLTKNCDDDPAGNPHNAAHCFDGFHVLKLLHQSAFAVLSVQRDCVPASLMHKAGRMLESSAEQRGVDLVNLTSDCARFVFVVLAFWFRVLHHVPCSLYLEAPFVSLIPAMRGIVPAFFPAPPLVIKRDARRGKNGRAKRVAKTLKREDRSFVLRIARLAEVTGKPVDGSNESAQLLKLTVIHCLAFPMILVEYVMFVISNPPRLEHG
jgi:hypothetical protein